MSFVRLEDIFSSYNVLRLRPSATTILAHKTNFSRLEFPAEQTFIHSLIYRTWCDCRRNCLHNIGEDSVSINSSVGVYRCIEVNVFCVSELLYMHLNLSLPDSTTNNFGTRIAALLKIAWISLSNLNSI